MKKLSVILSLLLVVSLVVVGFSCKAEEPVPPEVPSEGPVPLPPEEAREQVSVDDSYAGKEVEVAVGGSLTLHLESDPATGFEWELVTMLDTTVLEEVEHKYVGQEQVWTFKTLKVGLTGLYMEYSQPWEGGTKAAKTFTLTVLIK